MEIDSTFWVAVSFFIFFGALIYLKVPQKVNETLNKLISDIKNENKPKKVKSEWTSGFIAEDRELEQTQLVFGVEGLKNIDGDRFSLRALSDEQIQYSTL